MKKFLVAILAIVYISTTIGVNINMHYCMGKMVSWDFDNKGSKACPKCGMLKADNKDHGCCKDKHTFLKSNTDQRSTESGFLFVQQSDVSLPVAFAEVSSANLTVGTEENPISHAPPLNHGVPLYIYYCIYRI